MLTPEQREDLNTAHTYVQRVRHQLRNQPQPRGRKSKTQEHDREQVTQRLDRVTNDLILLSTYS